MDITLGPWKAEHSENKALAAAMGDEARKTVEKAAGFTAREAVKGKPAAKGYTISGVLKSAAKKGNTTSIFSTFNIWVDGTIPNVAPIQGTGFAEGSSTAEDAVRAITESRINKILETIKTGRVVKAA